jgi:NAD(P)H dehydrogenase (quinone)
MIVLYYSGSGNTQRMATTIAEAARSDLLEVKVESVERFNVSLLPNYDAIVLGSPTYFSNIAWPVKKLIDESIIHYNKERLKGKVAGIFTSSGTTRDGKDCLKMLEIALGLHHRMKVIEGVIRSAEESDEEVDRRIREYGKRLAKEVEKAS